MGVLKRKTQIDYSESPKWKAAKEAVQEMDKEMLRQLGKTREAMAEALYKDAPETVRGNWIDYFRRVTKNISEDIRRRIMNLTEPAQQADARVEGERISTRPFTTEERGRQAA